MPAYTRITTWVDGQALVPATWDAEEQAMADGYNAINDAQITADPLPPSMLAANKAAVPLVLFHFGGEATPGGTPIEDDDLMCAGGGIHAAAITPSVATAYNVAQLRLPSPAYLLALNVTTSVIAGINPRGASIANAGQHAVTDGSVTLDILSGGSSILTGLLNLASWEDLRAFSGAYPISSGQNRWGSAGARTRRYVSTLQGNPLISNPRLEANTPYQFQVTMNVELGGEQVGGPVGSRIGLSELCIASWLLFDHRT